jgi:two-component system sensor histidine kinase KdpD
VFQFTPESSFIGYWYILWVFVVVSLVSAVLLPIIGYRAVGFVFLLGVLAVSLFVSVGPTIFAALLAAVTWDYFFIPPAGTFHISEPEDVAMCLALLVSASVAGVLTSRIRRRERLIRSRERRTNALYRIASVISATGNRQAFASAVTENLASLLHGEIGIALKKVDGQLEYLSSGHADYWMTAEKERIVASWAFRHRKAAGYSTDTLASAVAWYIPLIGPTETVGVLAYKPKPDTRLSQDEENLLLAVARQLAVATERELFQERSRQMQQLAESERLYRTILNSVSHELRTPLTAIVGNASALQNSQIASNPGNRRQLSEEIVKNAARLNRVVSNLLDMSRLRSGKLSLKKDWHEIDDLIAVALDLQKAVLVDHHVVVRTTENLPLIRVDFQLLVQVLANLLVNAVTYTPAGTTIDIAARVTGSSAELIISDDGPGIPEESIPHLFEMFYRVPGSPTGGMGMGLAIARGIVEAHDGTIGVCNGPGGGTCFTIHLPLERQPHVPDDRGEV